MSLLSPLLEKSGITRVANITGLDVIGIPVVVATRPNARSLSVSQGKGLDLDSARASAILESVEQFHAERPSIPLRRASFEELIERFEVVDIRRLPRYFRPLAERDTMLWASAEDLGTGASVLVPFDMVHLDLRFPPRDTSGCFPVGSNGLASGNTLAEATVHGLLELIERDATALFFAMPPELQWLRRVNLQRIDDPACRSLVERFAAADIEVAVWDISSDVNLPAFACIIVESETERFRPVGQARGYGCHLDRSVALCRALTEAAQSRLTRIVGSRDDMGAEAFGELRGDNAIGQAQGIVGEGPGCPRVFHDVSTWRFETFAEDLNCILERLDAAGLTQALCVDLSRDDFPVSVVRTIIPGLEGAPEVPGYQPGERVRRACEGIS